MIDPELRERVKREIEGNRRTIRSEIMALGRCRAGGSWSTQRDSSQRWILIRKGHTGRCRTRQAGRTLWARCVPCSTNLWDVGPEVPARRPVHAGPGSR